MQGYVQLPDGASFGRSRSAKAQCCRLYLPLVGALAFAISILVTTDLVLAQALTYNLRSEIKTLGQELNQSMSTLQGGHGGVNGNENMLSGSSAAAILKKVRTDLHGNEDGAHPITSFLLSVSSEDFERCLWKSPGCDLAWSLSWADSYHDLPLTRPHMITLGSAQAATWLHFGCENHETGHGTRAWLLPSVNRSGAQQLIWAWGGGQQVSMLKIGTGVTMSQFREQYVIGDGSRSYVVLRCGINHG
eukprot:2879190-Amphidinium_carterae.2